MNIELSKEAPSDAITLLLHAMENGWALDPEKYVEVEYVRAQRMIKDAHGRPLRTHEYGDFHNRRRSRTQSGQREPEA